MKSFPATTALLFAATIPVASAFTSLNAANPSFVPTTPFTHRIHANVASIVGPIGPSKPFILLSSSSTIVSKSRTRTYFSPLDWFAPPKESVANKKNNEEEIRVVKDEISEAIANTDRGRNTNPTQKNTIHTLLSKLESLCPLTEPARDPRMGGPWIVLYTDAPPPSNGQLLFTGIAKQVIDLEGGRYRNELYVGGKGVDEDEDAWLTAVLDADWKEWDGVYLDAEEEGSYSSSVEKGANGSAAVEDFGATTWKVTFETLTLSLFQIPLFTQKFKAGTSRTWKMTFLDDDTRIVRAGKTGRDEDDWIFYMRRGKE